MTRSCLFNCKEEGPPGPIWYSQCGHDPKCCSCDDEPRCTYTEWLARKERQGVRCFDLYCPFCGNPCNVDDDCPYCDALPTKKEDTDDASDQESNRITSESVVTQEWDGAD